MKVTSIMLLKTNVEKMPEIGLSIMLYENKSSYSHLSIMLMKIKVVIENYREEERRNRGSARGLERTVC